MACREREVEPSPNSRKQRCFWFRTVLTDPDTVILTASFCAGMDKISAILGFFIDRAEARRACEGREANERGANKRASVGNRHGRRRERHSMAECR